MSTHENDNHLPMEDAAGVLNADTQPTYSPAFGQGIRFTMANESITIDVYQSAQHVKLTAKNAEVSLYGVEGASVTEERVMFFGQDKDSERLSVSPSGEVTLFLSADQTPTVPEQLSPAPAEPEHAPEPMQSGLVASEAEPSAAPEGEPGKEKNEVRVFVGRLVRDAKLQTFPNGKSRLNFRLAVARPDGLDTDFFNMYSTGDRANRYSGMKKGKLYEVRAYVQRHEQRQEDGSVKVVERYYAVGVRNR